MGWRENFHEDNRLFFEMCGGRCRKIYFCAAFLTFVHQASIRNQTCAAWIECSVSLAKGAAWSLAWPFYWINYTTGFVLMHPGGWGRGAKPPSSI